jgi:RNA polymerase sigma-70 factor, ECF subfamily
MSEFSPESVKTLVLQAKSGDADAFGRLYELYALKVFRFLYAQLPSQMDAEDLAAEVFLRSWNAMPRYKDRGYQFSTYLFRIAHNVLVDYYRKAKKTAQFEDQSYSAALSQSENIHSESLARLEHQELYTGLSKLKEDYRTVLVLRFLNDFSPQEAAAIMQRSPGAIRVLQHRALGALRNSLKSK